MATETARDSSRPLAVKPQRFSIQGSVQHQDSGAPLPRLLVRAYDKDVFFDDYLGQAWTEEDGWFEIEFTADAFRDVIERRPDVYLRVSDETGRILLVSTVSDVRRNAAEKEEFLLEIPHKELMRLPKPSRRRPPPWALC